MPVIYESYTRGQRVRVSGEVQWGEKTYRVATEGRVEEDTGLKKILVLLDEVDGDSLVCIYIPRNIVTAIQETVHEDDIATIGGR